MQLRISLVHTMAPSPVITKVKTLFHPSTMLRNLIALKVLLKDSIDVCSPRLISPSNSQTHELSDSGYPAPGSLLLGASEIPPVGAQAPRPLVQQPLWPKIVFLVGSTIEGPGEGRKGGPSLGWTPQ